MTIVQTWNSLHEEGAIIVDNVTHSLLKNSVIDAESVKRCHKHLTRSLEGHRSLICNVSDLSSICKTYFRAYCIDSTSNLTKIDESSQFMRELITSLDNLMFLLQQAFEPKEIILARLIMTLISPAASIDIPTEGRFPWLQVIAQNHEIEACDDLSSENLDTEPVFKSVRSDMTDLNGLLLAWRTSLQVNTNDIPIAFSHSQNLIKELSKMSSALPLKSLLATINSRGFADPQPSGTSIQRSKVVNKK